MDEPPEHRGRLGFLPWIVLVAVGVVIFLVGVTLGAVSSHTATVTVSATTTVTAFVGGAVPTTVAGPISGLLTQFGDGQYQVGVDISPGNYHTDGGKGCYWERLSDLSGGFGAIITNGEPTQPTTVRVESSDKAFGVHGGCTWVQVP